MHFGLPRSHNDTNVLQRSPLFAWLADGDAPQLTFKSMVTNTQWAIIVKMAYVPHGQLLSRQYATLKIKRGVHFAKAQEAQRKDIEQAFWVLQSRFAIVCGLARFWD